MLDYIAYDCEAANCASHQFLGCNSASLSGRIGNWITHVLVVSRYTIQVVIYIYFYDIS